MEQKTLKEWLPAFPPFPTKSGLCYKGLNHHFLTFTRRQILDSSKVEEFADNNFKFEKNGRKLSKQVKNTVGKGEIARYKQFLLFPVFSKGLFPRDVKRCYCVGMG